MARLLTVFLGVSLAVFGEIRVMGDWPTLRGTTERNGRVDSTLKPPFQLLWATEMPDERMGTAVEPIVSGGKVFAATHAGSIYALDADSGAGLWRFPACGGVLPFSAVVGKK